MLVALQHYSHPATPLPTHYSLLTTHYSPLTTHYSLLCLLTTDLDVHQGDGTASIFAEVPEVTLYTPS